MRDAYYWSLATEVVCWTCVVFVFTIVALRLLSLQTVTTIDGFSTCEALSTKMMRNVGTNRRFLCAVTLFAITVATICGHCYGAYGQWLSVVVCPSMSFPVYDMEKNFERKIYFYQMDNSPEKSSSHLEGILENLGSTIQYVVGMSDGMGNQYGTSVRGGGVWLQF